MTSMDSRARGSLSRAASALIDGNQRSVATPGNVPEKPDRAMPMMVNDWLFIETFRPMSAGSAAKRRRQSRSLMITPGSSIACSSKPRPIEGSFFSTRK
jgi:hypothetical protein